MARKRKKEQAGGGAPEWMVTYGDMVTLLLTFFVMLLAMSEVKKDARFVDFMQAIKEAFGYVGGVEQTPLEEVETPRNIDLTEMLIIPVRSKDFSESDDEGLRGRQHSVTNIRRGDRFDVGGKLYFSPLGDGVSDENRERLGELADKLRGLSTQIEIRGHCSALPVEGSPHASHFDLAYARARSVADALKSFGIDEQRLIIVSAGINEPVARQAYTSAEREQNDVVEILEMNSRVGELGG
jgi:chemotaxis protein MotB